MEEERPLAYTVVSARPPSYEGACGCLKLPRAGRSGASRECWPCACCAMRRTRCAHRGEHLRTGRTSTAGRRPRASGPDDGRRSSANSRRSDTWRSSAKWSSRRRPTGRPAATPLPPARPLLLPRSAVRSACEVAGRAGDQKLVLRQVPIASSRLICWAATGDRYRASTCACSSGACACTFTARSPGAGARPPPSPRTLDVGPQEEGAPLGVGQPVRRGDSHPNETRSRTSAGERYGGR